MSVSSNDRQSLCLGSGKVKLTLLNAITTIIRQGGAQFGAFESNKEPLVAEARSLIGEHVPGGYAIFAAMSDPKPADEDAAGRAKTLLALVFVLALVLGGLILVHYLRKQSQLQDCFMQGRTNCAPINDAP
ncbi:MAG: hypothetical protein ABSH33_10515 [Steroidobacteraceae bacterium]